MAERRVKQVSVAAVRRGPSKAMAGPRAEEGETLELSDGGRMARCSAMASRRRPGPPGRCLSRKGRSRDESAGDHPRHGTGPVVG